MFFLSFLPVFFFSDFFFFFFNIFLPPFFSLGGAFNHLAPCWSHKLQGLSWVVLVGSMKTLRSEDRIRGAKVIIVAILSWYIRRHSNITLFWKNNASSLKLSACEQHIVLRVVTLCPFLIHLQVFVYFATWNVVHLIEAQNQDEGGGSKLIYWLSGVRSYNDVGGLASRQKLKRQFVFLAAGSLWCFRCGDKGVLAKLGGGDMGLLALVDSFSGGRCRRGCKGIWLMGGWWVSTDDRGGVQSLWLFQWQGVVLKGLSRWLRAVLARR